MSVVLCASSFLSDAHVWSGLDFEKKCEESLLLKNYKKK